MKFKRRLTGAQKRAADFPVATIAAYGPTNQTATKIAVGIVEKPNGPVASMQRWFWNGTLDIRQDTKVADEVGQFIKLHQVKKTVISEKIMGCPHEEGIDYPDGEVCPQCPFWAGRDRFAPEAAEDGRADPFARARLLAQLASKIKLPVRGDE